MTEPSSLALIAIWRAGMESASLGTFLVFATSSTEGMQIPRKAYSHIEACQRG